MNTVTTTIPREEIHRQLELCRRAGELLPHGPGRPAAFVDTYGCQQNEADSERLRGYLREMGCAFTDDEGEADLILINTCAIRQHAEQRVLGNVGALVHTKRRRPGQIICLCGCAMQRPGMAEQIRRSYRHVDLVFGPHALWRFPQLLLRVLEEKKRVFDTEDSPGAIAEGIPAVRQSGLKAWVSVMYGCNNFCSYCIVPYVRGRERSRRPEDILAEVEALARAGCRDITLLGQNVNSYGKDLGLGVDFADLLERVNAVPGDFRIRFMTSHPKDAGEKLFETMARCEKAAPHFHLPVQSGCDRVLAAMNRGYTRGQYLDKVRRLRALIPHIVLTSDIIVGFPGETREEFLQTLSLVEEVEYDALFTFLFSPRPGTPAAALPDPVSPEEKQRNFQELVDAQNRISAKKHAAYVGTVQQVLVDGVSGDPEHPLTGRTPGGRLVHLTGDAGPVGSLIPVKITGSSTWALFGVPADADPDNN